jgi:hypothetical protein
MKKMMTEAVLKKTIMQHLIEKYGHVDTERFISLVIKEPFDYTKWSEDLFSDMTTDQLFDEIEAMEKRAAS